jgi:hypothetical protein
MRICLENNLTAEIAEHAEKNISNDKISKSRLENFEFTDLEKSALYPFLVIPAKAGIQLIQVFLGSRLRGSDHFFGFLRDHQILAI